MEPRFHRMLERKIAGPFGDAGRRDHGHNRVIVGLVELRRRENDGRALHFSFLLREREKHENNIIQVVVHRTPLHPPQNTILQKSSWPDGARRRLHPLANEP